MCVLGVECHGEMRVCGVTTLILALVLGVVTACGPGRGAGRRRGPKKLLPLVENQYFPDVDEKTLAASGPSEGAITRQDPRFHKNLVVNYNQDIIFKDEEGTGADRVMTQRCQEKLNTLAISVMNQWPGVRLRVTEGWDEEQHHKQNSLHYEGRAVDITTSDRDAGKLGMLARLAKEAGFDWVFFESRSHIHCSVKSEPSHGKYGGCFSAESTVQTSAGETRKLKDLRAGEHILTMDPETLKPVFSEVLLFIDYNPEEEREFMHLELESGRTLTVTPSHLLMTMERNETRTVYAAMFEVGDVVLVSDSNRIINDVVRRVIRSFKKGVYAPLTTTGTVIVDGVVASCYATIDSQEVAHWAFVPIRIMYNLKEGFSRMFRLIYKPIDSWSIGKPPAPKPAPPAGVYWYAEVLYSIGHYLIPSRMYK